MRPLFLFFRHKWLRLWVLVMMPVTTLSFASESYPLGQFPQEVIIQGPVRDLQLVVDGKNIFEPVHLDVGLSNQDKAHRIFEFTRDKFLPWDAQVSMPLGALLYGYGFGFCGEQARTMASLLYQHGIPARMISMKHHVVLEGQVDGQWQLYDPQHRIDYYRQYLRPVDFDQIRQGQTLVPQGVDPVGVLWSHTRWVFETGTPQYSDVTWTLPAPKLHLATQQTLRIRPRQTNEFFELPIVYHRRPAYQSNRIPYYLLEITHRFEDEEPAHFEKNLPILDVAFEGPLPQTVTINDAQVAVDPAQLDEWLIGEPKSLSMAMPPGSSCKITYALAGWIGERLFQANPEASLRTSPWLPDGQVSVITQPTMPRLWIEAVKLPNASKYQEQYELDVTLAWTNISSDRSLNFELIVDELKSDIALEYLASLPTHRFVWTPKKHGADGFETIQLRWRPVPEKSRFVPDTFRTLVTQISGPHVRAGRNVSTLSFTLPAKPSP